MLIGVAWERSGTNIYMFIWAKFEQMKLHGQILYTLEQIDLLYTHKKSSMHQWCCGSKLVTYTLVKFGCAWLMAQNFNPSLKEDEQSSKCKAMFCHWSLDYEVFLFLILQLHHRWQILPLRAIQRTPQYF